MECRLNSSFKKYRRFKFFPPYLVESDTQIDVDQLPGGRMQQEVVGMAVAKANQVSKDGRSREGIGVAMLGDTPGSWLGEILQEEVAQNRSLQRMKGIINR